MTKLKLCTQALLLGCSREPGLEGHLLGVLQKQQAGDLPGEAGPATLLHLVS